MIIDSQSPVKKLIEKFLNAFFFTIFSGSLDEFFINATMLVIFSQNLIWTL